MTDITKFVPQQNQMLVTFDDTSMMRDVKRALKLMRGVKTVKMGKFVSADITKTKGYKEAMADVENGRIYKSDNVDDMVKQILG